MTVRYAVGSHPHAVDVLTGGFSLADHLQRLDPASSGSEKEWVTFMLKAGGEIALRDSSIIAIEMPAVEP
ncbi:hypothetical protein [Streptomyces rubrogriseus]|uniref:hypothetical protein n=1 Tax=Streptomyces rubrogriseus TaxID=194673 RepID=UPI000D599092|nr:hypothetical protein [Streptomyces rubrogriseus]